MANCKSCGNPMPDKRKEMGYSVCVSCSTESKWSAVPVVHHKTGNEFQVVKDPEVAAEFVAKSSRCGFGTLRGMVGSWKKPTVKNKREKKKIEPLRPKSFAVVVAKKKVEVEYKDDQIAPQVLQKLDSEGRESAIQLIDLEFKQMNLSPIGRKQLLHIVECSL